MDQVSIIVLGTVAVFTALLAYLFLNERGMRRYNLVQQRIAERQAAKEQSLLHEQIARQEKVITFMEMLNVDEPEYEKFKPTHAPEFVGYVP